MLVNDDNNLYDYTEICLNLSFVYIISKTENLTPLKQFSWIITFKINDIFDSSQIPFRTFNYTTLVKLYVKSHFWKFHYS